MKSSSRSSGEIQKKRSDEHDPTIVPAFMAEDVDAPTGLEEAVGYRSLQRLKVIQKSADSDLIEAFGIGTCIIGNSDLVVCTTKAPFRFVPIVFAPEWLVVNDRKDPSGVFIADRSFDSKSVIAQRSRNPALRVEHYGDNHQFKRTYVENLSFFVRITDCKESPDLVGDVVCMGFAKGEHKTGRRFIDNMMAKKSRLYGMEFEAMTSAEGRKNASGEWWGFDIEFVGFVDQETYERNKADHIELHELYTSSRIIVESSDVDDDRHEQDAKIDSDKL